MLSKLVEAIRGRRYVPDPMDLSPDHLARERRVNQFPLPEDKDQRFKEEQRRALVIQRYVKRHGATRQEFGVQYGPFYTEGLALKALQEDKARNTGLYR